MKAVLAGKWLAVVQGEASMGNTIITQPDVLEEVIVTHHECKNIVTFPITCATQIAAAKTNTFTATNTRCILHLNRQEKAILTSHFERA